MAEVDVGRALAGLGAAFKNEMPAFIQQTRQEDALARGMEDRVLAQEEKRKETLFKDTATARQYLQSGNIPAIIDIYSDRVNLLGRAGIDTSNSERLLSYAQAALNDPNALSQLTGEINTVYDTGRAFNVAMEETPAAYRSLDLQAQAAGFERGSAEYQRFMRFGGGSADEGAAKTEFFDNGAVLEKPRNGVPKLFVNGQQIVDPEEFAIQMDLAVKSGPLMAGDIATATTRGGAEEGRAQGVITSGLDAAGATGVIRRSLDLLDRVKTGGPEAAKLFITNFAGVTGADEGELSANLGKSVLKQLKEIFGAAFTSGEGVRLERIEAGFGKSSATNRRLLENALSISIRSAETAIRRAEARGDYETADEIRDALEFDIFSATEERAELDASNAATIIVDGAEGDAVYAALPSGAKYRYETETRTSTKP